MSMQLRPLFLASAIALAVTALGTASADDKLAQEVIDARQESQILTTYALSPYLRAHDLNVSVHDGKATLSGKVEEGVVKDLAKQIALGVKGVKEVDNQIVVQPEYVAPRPSAQGYGELIDDATITTAVKSKLLWSKHVDGMSTDVTTVAGKVALRGSADNAAAKELAGRLAMNTRGVASVDNQLEVKNRKPGIVEVAKSSAKEAGQEFSDSWITTKVKSTLLYSTNVNGADISVSTTNGIVSLSGKVGSGAEQALAIELAQHVRGVRSVYSRALKY